MFLHITRSLATAMWLGSPQRHESNITNDDTNWWWEQEKKYFWMATNSDDITTSSFTTVKNWTKQFWNFSHWQLIFTSQETNLILFTQSSWAVERVLMCFEEMGSNSRTSVCSQATVSTDLDSKEKQVYYTK